MSLFGDLFRGKSAESLALINIGAGSVAGALVFYREGAAPTIAYSRRVPIESRTNEPQERAMFRALDFLGAGLITDGAPALARLTGSGAISSVIVAVDAPWQETLVRTERFEGERPFTFTKAIVSQALERVGTVAAGKILSDESVIGTVLNGYETKNPYGKKAHRASVIILASRIDQTVWEGIRTKAGQIFHTRRVTLVSGSSLRYQSMRLAFPHEQNALILDATGPLVALSLVRNGLLMAVSETPDGAVGTPEWGREVEASLSELAKQFPLPRTIFLLVRDTDAENVFSALSGPSLTSLWLSDNPPKLVAVQASHLSSRVKQATTMPPDLPLLLMALFGGGVASRES